MTRSIRFAAVLLLSAASAARAGGPGKPAGFDDAIWPDDPVDAGPAQRVVPSGPVALGPGLPEGHDDTSWPVERPAPGKDDAFARGPNLPTNFDDATWPSEPALAPVERPRAYASRPDGQSPGLVQGSGSP